MVAPMYQQSKPKMNPMRSARVDYRRLRKPGAAATCMRVWLMLHHSGRIAPSPIEARARMRSALAAEESAGDDRSVNERQ